MTRALLTLDLGNSSGSAARVVAASASPSAEILHRWGRDASDALPESEAVAHAIARAREFGVDFAVVSAVGSPEREAAVVEALGNAGLAFVTRPAAGLVMDIEHPETCGVDRQYAMRAALTLAPRALVVDAGTALTVDVGERSPGGAVFRGGAIALGPGATARAMSAAGARLPEFAIDPNVPALGRSTVEALRSGVAVGFRGAVRELADAIVREAFGGAAGVTPFLTGGARDFARGPLEDRFGSALVEDALLVHRGLALAGLDAATHPR